MAPAPSQILELVSRSQHDTPNSLLQRDLQSPTHTQKVTLGVIAAYVVIIAILWNVPYVRMVLWPFKVCISSIFLVPREANHRGVTDAGHRLS